MIRQRTKTIPNPNEALRDDAIRRRIYLENYADRQSRQTLKFLDELQRDLIAKISEMEVNGRAQLSIKQQRELLASVKDLTKEIYGRLQQGLESDLTKLAGDQVEHANGSLQNAVSGQTGAATGLTAKTLDMSSTAAYGIAKARPMQGKLLKEWFADLEPNQRKRIQQQLRISFAEGESVSAAIRRIRETMKIGKRGADALVRTSFTHIAAVIDQEHERINEDILEGVVWTSILDSRTTPICRSRDGKFYKLMEGPRPPAHIRCRSTTEKVLKGVKRLKRETYGDWLKRQPETVQNAVLGPTRAKAWRKGDLTLDGFVSRSGKALTLKELGLR